MKMYSKNKIPQHQVYFVAYGKLYVGKIKRRCLWGVDFYEIEQYPNNRSYSFSVHKNDVFDNPKSALKLCKKEIKYWENKICEIENYKGEK